MWNRFLVSVFAAFTCVGVVTAGELTRGLTITGGQNASADLMLERIADPAAENGILKVRVSLAQAKDLKGYGFTLEYDAAKYSFVSATESDGNLLASGSGRQTLFLVSDRTPGSVVIGAVKVDGLGASGAGGLAELVFKTNGAPAASDFRVSEGVLVGLDGNNDPLSRVEIGDLAARPDRFALDQNVPNPFNPATVIGYQLSEAGAVRLAVYNLLGQEVRVLVDERMEAGHYRAAWDGMDTLGRRAASGVYLYRIQAGDYSATRRMLLLK